MANCVFCSIVAGEIPADRVHEDEYVIAFRDREPVAPVHILVIPKQHVTDLEEADDALTARVFAAAKQLGREHSAEHGYRLAANVGPAADVRHLHVHVVGGAKHLNHIAQTNTAKEVSAS